MTVDLITITFNNFDGLKKTYDSLIEQTYEHFNWIVVDGDSQDKTKEFLAQVSQNDIVSLTYISEKDNGIYDAMNKGMTLSKGDYFLFLNAGDCLFDNSVLSNIFGSLVSTPVLLYGNFMRELKDGSLSFTKAKPIKYIYHSLPTSHQAIFYHKQIKSLISYDLNYKICGDYYLTSKVIKDFNLIYNKKYIILDDIVSIFEYNGVSRNNLNKLFEEASQVQKEVFNMNYIYRKFSYILKIIRNKLL